MSRLLAAAIHRVRTRCACGDKKRKAREPNYATGSVRLAAIKFRCGAALQHLDLHDATSCLTIAV